jgi:hypothetical protein
MVLGRIAGWSPPFQLTITQLATVITSFLVLVWTWPLWAPPLPDPAATIVVTGAPIAAGWVARRLRVEGRSLPRAALGRLTLWCFPSAGTVAGRPHRDHRAVFLPAVKMFIASEDWGRR